MKYKYVYELVLWDRGNKIELGWYLTKKEALEVKRIANKHRDVFGLAKEIFQDKLAGFEIIRHNLGGMPSYLKYREDEIT